MKPLVLKTFNINDRMQGWSIDSESPPLSEWSEIPVDLAESIARGKRLTNAELAAEWWKSLATIPSLVEVDEHGMGARETEIAKTLERFATLPHYDEVPG